jgi:hypothetical protein
VAVVPHAHGPLLDGVQDARCCWFAALARRRRRRLQCYHDTRADAAPRALTRSTRRVADLPTRAGGGGEGEEEGDEEEGGCAPGGGRRHDRVSARPPSS